MELFAGPVLERAPSAALAEGVRYAELAPSEPLPKPTTLERWRSRFTDDTAVGLRVPTRCWQSDEGGSLGDPGSTWLAEASEALRAALVVIVTDGSVTTGARDRARLRHFFERFPRREGSSVVWRATGLWEPDTLQSAARSFGVIGGFDGLDDPVPEGDLVYASLRAEGLRRSFSHAVLADVVDRLRESTATRAYVAIQSKQSVREARLFDTIAVGSV